jgi:putative hemolysin
VLGSRLHRREPQLTDLLVILALTALSGVFAGAEIAVIAVRRTRLQQLEEEGRSAARSVLALRDHPERFLATVQVGITILGATAAVFGGARVAEKVAPLLRPIVGAYAPEVALAAMVALVSFLTIVVGELVPKSLALRSAEPYALAIARPLLGLAWLARPMVWVLTKTSNVLLRPFGDRTTFSESRLSSEELAQMVNDAARSGALDREAGDIAARALEFGELTAGDVMVPRQRIVAIRRDASEEDLRRLLLEEGHARMPVVQGSLDNVVGYVVAKDLFSLLFQRDLVVLEDVVRPAYFVPETARAVGVLREMQRRHVQLGVVVDEHGGVAGLVTLEDLVEELVGDIVGEAGEEEQRIRREPSGSALVRGDTPIREVNREIGLDLEEGEGFTTVAGLCNALAGGGIPQKGARLVAQDGTTIEVVDATPRMVRGLRLTRAVEPETTTP